MPIDFERVPPRVAVPLPPRPSALLWAILLAMTIGLGFGLTVAVRSKGPTAEDPWFWCCALFFPALVWIFLFSVSRGIAHARHSESLAINRVSDRFEQECHRAASLPLVVLGHAWCFSARDEDDTADSVVSGSLQLCTRPGAAQPGTDVRARWLEIPGEPFHYGNELVEYKRHLAVSNWLFARLVDRVSAGLAELPAHTLLHVDVCADSLADVAELESRLQGLILVQAPTLQLKVNATAKHFSLAYVDSWHDQLKPGDARLLVCLQLRKAVSELLQDGVAEAGAALLVARPETVRNAPSLHLHRPAQGEADGKSSAVDLAIRWCRADASQVSTIWSHALSEGLMRPAKSSSKLSRDAQWLDVATTVGNCNGAGAWLATVLALEHARQTGSPQLVLSELDNELIGLACKLST